MIGGARNYFRKRQILISPLFYRASPAAAARPTQTLPPGSCLWAASAGRQTRSGSGSILVSSGPWQTCSWWRTPSLRWETVTTMTCHVTCDANTAEDRGEDITWPPATCPPELGAANLFWCDKNVPRWCSHISLLSPPGVICITGLWNPRPENEWLARVIIREEIFSSHKAQIFCLHPIIYILVSGEVAAGLK